MVVLLVGGAIYGFYNYDYLQEMMCVADMRMELFMGCISMITYKQ